MEILFALGGALVATAWSELAHRHREVRSHRALCNHVWDEPVEVAKSLRGNGPHFFKQFCFACGEQRNCDAPEAEEEDMVLVFDPDFVAPEDNDPKSGHGVP